MPKAVRIRAEYKQPFDKKKYMTALLAIARQRLEEEAPAEAVRAEERRHG